MVNAPSTPVIITNPKNEKDELNAPITLTCEAGGSPMPVIWWFKDGVQLRGPGAVGSMYVIPELEVADRGSYHCEASNGFRDPVKSSEATVLITGNCNTSWWICLVAVIVMSFLPFGYMAIIMHLTLSRPVVHAYSSLNLPHRHCADEH